MDLDELRRAATPGKVERRGFHVGRPRKGREYVRPLCLIIHAPTTDDPSTPEQCIADAEYLAALWNAAPQLIQLARENKDPTAPTLGATCGKEGCDRPSVCRVLGSLAYEACEKHREEIERKVGRE